MAIDSSVRWFHSDQAGAPQIMAQPGDLIAILDACLLNGFGSKAVDDIVVSGEVATVTISSGHDFEKWAVIRIEGATPGELDGDWRVTSATGSTLTFDCPGIADTTATGTITISRATPGHWEKAFSDTHKAAYRSTHPDNAGFLLRIDDSASGTGVSPVRGYESMTDIDTGTADFPLSSIIPEYSWLRSYTASSSYMPRPWTVVAEGQFVWLLINPRFDPRLDSVQFWYGRGLSGRPEDVLISGLETNSPVSWSADFLLDLAGGRDNCKWVAKGSKAEPERITLHGVAGYTDPGGGEAFPGALDAYMFAPIIASSAGKIRTILPALQGLTGHQGAVPVGAERAIVEPTSANPRPVLLVRSQGARYNTKSYLAFDIAGPWR